MEYFQASLRTGILTTTKKKRFETSFSKDYKKKMKVKSFSFILNQVLNDFNIYFFHNLINCKVKETLNNKM